MATKRAGRYLRAWRIGKSLDEKAREERRAERGRVQLTQEEAAALVPTAQSTWNAWERGGSAPQDVRIMMRVARLVGVDAEELWER